MLSLPVSHKLDNTYHECFKKVFIYLQERETHKQTEQQKELETEREVSIAFSFPEWWQQ